MRDKNNSIYHFIMELERRKDRERAFREKLRREHCLGSAEQLSASQLDSSAIPEKPFNKETRPLSEGSQPTNEKQESDLRVTDHVEIGSRGIGFFKAGVFEFRRKGYHLETELGVSSALAAFSFISTIVLLQIDALLNQNLHSNGLQFLKRAIPYWIAFNTALGMFWLVAIAVMLFRMYVLKRKQKIMDECEQSCSPMHTNAELKSEK